MIIDDAKVQHAMQVAMAAAAGAEDLSTLPAPLRTVALVHAGQGVIDNGGLRYFSRRIFRAGRPTTCSQTPTGPSARPMRPTSLPGRWRFFRSPDPHLHVDRRNAFMDAFVDEAGSRMAESNRLQGEANTAYSLALPVVIG